MDSILFTINSKYFFFSFSFSLVKSNSIRSNVIFKSLSLVLPVYFEFYRYFSIAIDNNQAGACSVHSKYKSDYRSEARGRKKAVEKWSQMKFVVPLCRNTNYYPLWFHVLVQCTSIAWYKMRRMGFGSIAPISTYTASNLRFLSNAKQFLPAKMTSISFSLNEFIQAI